MSDQEQAATTDAATSADSSGHEGAGGHAVTAAPLADLFEREEIDQFDQDDAEAGRAIGKMLSIFFLYTVLAMALVAWWTYRSITQ